MKKLNIIQSNTEPNSNGSLWFDDGNLKYKTATGWSLIGNTTSDDTESTTSVTTYSNLGSKAEKELVKIYPSATAFDQMLRYLGSESTDNIQVDYSYVNSTSTKTTLVDDYDEPETVTTNTVDLIVEDNSIFSVGSLIWVNGVYGFEEDGTTLSDRELILYVTAVSGTTGITVIAVNGKTINGISNVPPTINAGTTILLIATTNDGTSIPQFDSSKVSSYTYCQNFSLQAFKDTASKVTDTKWILAEIDQVVISEFKSEVESAFLFGKLGNTKDLGLDSSIYLTDGIWRQAGVEFHYEGETFTKSVVTELFRKGFTSDKRSSNTKFLIGGSRLISAISNFESSECAFITVTPIKCFDMQATEISSPFGTYIVLKDNSFDNAGFANNGIVIDPAYIKKYVYKPFSIETTDSTLTLSETSCVVLLNPKCHMRIVRM